MTKGPAHSGSTHKSGTEIEKNMWVIPRSCRSCLVLSSLSSLHHSGYNLWMAISHVEARTTLEPRCEIKSAAVSQQSTHGLDGLDGL